MKTVKKKTEQNKEILTFHCWEGDKNSQSYNKINKEEVSL